MYYWRYFFCQGFLSFVLLVILLLPRIPLVSQAYYFFQGFPPFKLLGLLFLPRFLKFVLLWLLLLPRIPIVCTIRVTTHSKDQFRFFAFWLRPLVHNIWVTTSKDSPSICTIGVTTFAKNFRFDSTIGVTNSSQDFPAFVPLVSLLLPRIPVCLYYWYYFFQKFSPICTIVVTISSKDPLCLYF